LVSAAGFAGGEIARMALVFLLSKVQRAHYISVPSAYHLHYISACHLVPVEATTKLHAALAADVTVRAAQRAAAAHAQLDTCSSYNMRVAAHNLDACAGRGWRFEQGYFTELERYISG
jgi:hypothetical protein